MVDDDPEVRGSLADLLLQEGYPVTTAAEGDEALRACRTQGPPGLVITDLMMPGMQGTELIQALNRDPRQAAVPTILLTAAGPHAARRAIEQAGVDTVLVLKPVSVDRLLNLVSKLLDPHRSGSA